MSRARLDRLITLGAVYPLRRLAHAAPGIPVLMYHSIVDDPGSTSLSYYGITTSPARFAEHLQFLRDEGYRGITMDELAGLLAAGGPRAGDPRCVAITFDDGYRDNFTTALPLLKSHGFTATVYLPTASIGDTRQTFKGRECLVWDEVRQMKREGVAVGSHSHRHEELNKLDDDALKRELREPREMIEQKLGCAVTCFSYPYAFPENDTPFVARLRNLLSETGYRNGVTTVLGRVRPGDDPLLLKRLPVNSGDDIPFLRAKLQGAYDWIHSFQYASKLAQHFILRR